MPKTHCPNCDAIISVGEPQEGAIIVCLECGVELEIISSHPFELDFTEDWQKEWEEE
jgi:lysine biosynthesis protein LysW